VAQISESFATKLPMKNCWSLEAPVTITTILGTASSFKKYKLQRIPRPDMEAKHHRCKIHFSRNVKKELKTLFCTKK